MKDQQCHEWCEQIVMNVERQVFVQQSEGYGFHNLILRDTQSSEKINDRRDQEQPMYESLKQD